jgi:ABC-type oligopeptide transport system substrate-binding subunit
MKRPISRRSLLGVSPLALAACSSDGDYFGNTKPRRRQHLVYQIGAEPETLDPANSQAGSENYILPSLFEGLVTLDPGTQEPLAGIATHYQSDSRHTKFTFYLRGHPQPLGTVLPNSPRDLSHASPPAGRQPARWSDGTVITAHDFVYSWRRAVNPATASPNAAFLYCIGNAEEVNAGKRPVHDLAVEALDDFTLRVEMSAPTPFFLHLQDILSFYAVPRQAIDSAREQGIESAWTRPQHIVTSGPFTVREWRPYEAIRLRKNRFYYESDFVALEEITLLPTASATAIINLYKAGEADSMLGRLVAPVFLPLLRRKKDFQTRPAFWCMFYAVNTTVAPFDNVLVRYALNMATDKNAIAAFLGAGQTPARGLMPPLDGYPNVSTLPIEIDGKSFDVVEHNPEAARELMSKAGVRALRIEVLYPRRPSTQDLPEILQQQWRNTLGAEVVMSVQEEKAWLQRRNSLQYRGVSERGWWGDYLDPNTFLQPFLSGPSIIGSGWSDPRYDSMLAAANASANPVDRMRKLADCERFLLRAMPILPLYYNTLTYLQKPYVRGLEPGKVDIVRFKNARIDTNWRPS